MRTPEPTRPVPQYPIESVDRALRLLALFRDMPELRLAEVRDRLQVGQSTAHRLMAMLVYHGFATQNPVSRLYQAGPALVEIGLAAVHKFELRQVARPHLEELAGVTGETVHLGVLEDRDVRFVDCIESPLALRVSGRVGLLVPAHATSLGKAMLAAMDETQVRGLYRAEAIPAVTAKTIVRRADLLRELEAVRERGYARNSEESELGVTSVSAAIVTPHRGLLGAVSVAAPLTRVDARTATRHGALVRAASERISADL